MELHLVGGRNYNGQKQTYWKLVREFIVSKNITRILFIGTASESHVGPEALIFFKNNINLPEQVQVLDAEIENELATVHGSTVYVLGGHRQLELLDFIHKTPVLENAIRTCPYYFGESMGAKLVGSKMRVGENASPLVSGLGILKDTVIEGHYSQKQRQQSLKDEVKVGNLKYGLGIDEDAEVVTTPETFPKFRKNGPGIVEIITLQTF